VFNVTISSGMTSSSFDMDIINNMIQDLNKMFFITVRLLSTCLPITINSDITSVTIIDDEGMVYHDCLFPAACIARSLKTIFHLNLVRSLALSIII